jgi:hypothetical protein
LYVFDREDIWPDCAICGKPVEKMVTEFLEDFNTRKSGWRIKVECHGDSEETFLPQDVLLEKIVCVERGVAFKPTKQLGMSNGQKELPLSLHQTEPDPGDYQGGLPKRPE